jgi:DNA helicase-2/ATP-dependent DNA helicase PcrA
MEDISHILDPLNDAQREAVTAAGGNRLVLAGAGSGKTRVLVHRIAWLIQVEHLAPWSLLAVTFTNKAAREMRTRIEEILQQPIGGMWVGTFHGLAHRFLRAHWQDARLPQHFQILDSDDQLRLVKRLLKELQLDESRYPPRQVVGFINREKDEGRRPEHLDDGGDFYQRKLIEVYREYQASSERAGQVDFADLLLRTHELLRDRPDIRHHYQERFAHILVDEFQDTNTIQYAWLRLLAGDRDHLFLVGDDDQSIYGWRGARVENIQSFQRDYPNTQVVRLEQNYRSTGTILKAANALIAHNPTRLGKNLWTQDREGEPILRYAAFNEVDEARFVADRIRGYVADEGYRRAECAILYRTTAQSRLFEEALIQAQIPYRVYGGLRFFERAEIKDAMAYLRLVANPDDDTAFERAVNTPMRGIGPRTLENLREQARETRVSLWRAARDLMASGTLPPRAAGAIGQFLGLIDRHRLAVPDLNLEGLTNDLIAAAGLEEHYRKEKDGKGQDRIENLGQLVETAGRFRHELGNGEVEGEQEALVAFLAHATLESGEAQADEFEDGVQLMTLHSAKGLEFPIVFLVGVEEGLFPHSLSANDPNRLEEERRLCYVGMTRAMHQLFVSHAESRRFRGSEDRPFPSRFLREIPPELVREVRAGGLSRSSAWGQASSPTSGARREGTTSGSASIPETGKGGGFHLGQGVRHPKFGEGVVLNSEGIGAAARIQVKFHGEGTKWLVLAYAKLEPLA